MTGKTTRKQKQIIHILEHQLIEKGLLDEAGYRLMLMGLFGKESSINLRYDEGAALIDQLVRMGGKLTWSPKRRGRMFNEEASIEGLRREVIQLAKERYGEDYEKPLIALCRKLRIDDYATMDVRHAKAVKETLLRLENEGPYTAKKARGFETDHDAVPPKKTNSD